MGTPQVTTEPAIQPVGVDEVKRALLIQTNEDDDTIYRRIKAATRYVETWTRRTLINTTFTETLSCFPPGGTFRLTRAPLVSVASIQYVDTAGDTQTLSTSLYTVITDQLVGRVDRAYDQVWPVTRDIRNAVTITYTAGHGTARDDVPPTCRDAVTALVGHWMENREPVITGTIVAKMPLHIESLLWSERILEAV